jgi:hypothetical protein
MQTNSLESVFSVGDLHVHAGHTESHIHVDLNIFIVVVSESFIVSGVGLLNIHSTESHVHFNMFTAVVA